MAQITEKITPEYIRKRFEYLMAAWKENREEGDTNTEYSVGRVWTTDEKVARGNRPCMSFDLLSPYTNKVINNLRMNPLGIEVLPRGLGANDKTANNTADKIRQIQYDSVAQSARITAIENAVIRNIGFYRISVEYKKGTFDREIVIKRVPNSNQVLIDCDFRNANATDIKDFFYFEEWTKDRFRKEFPKAEERNYDFDKGVKSADYFAKPDMVMMAEYWCKEATPDTLCLVEMDGEEQVLYASDIKKAGMTIKGGQVFAENIDGVPVVRGEILAQRPESRERVCQYLTNGFEILSETEWLGSYLPLVTMMGREQWVKSGTGDKRVILSLISLCRDAAKEHAYAKSTEVEVLGMTPKTPFIVPKGAIDGNREDWNALNQRPVAYIEYDPMPDGYPSGTMLPPPQRQTYEPPIQAFAQVAEEARRSVMDAVGIDTLPTAAQRASQKSGIALQKIQDQQTVGAFHFTDSFRMGIDHEGRILADLIPKVYATGQKTSVRKRDESYEVIDVQAEAFAGEHDITVKAGPNQDSERQEALEFATQLATPEMIGIALQGNPKASKLIALAIQLRSGGPIMEAIANLFDPEEQGAQGDPKQALQQAQMQMQQMQQAIQALDALANDLEQKLQQEKAKNETTLAVAGMNNATKLEIEKMRLEMEGQQIALDKQRLETERLRAVLDKAMQANSERMKLAQSQRMEPGEDTETE